MRQRYVESDQAQRRGAGGGLPVQDQQRLAAAVGEYLHFPPADATDPRSQRLRCGLLGGEAGRQLRKPRSVALPLPIREDAAQKALAEIVDRAFDAGDLDDVDADSDESATIGIELGLVLVQSVPHRAGA